MRRLRILFVLSRGEFGGAEESTIAALRYRPDDVDARVALLAPGMFERDLVQIGVPAAVLPLTAPDLRGRARLTAMLHREIGRVGPDLIHAIGNKAALASLSPSKVRRIPLIWHKVDFWYDRWGAASLARQCRKVFVPSRACGAVVPRDRLVVIDPTLAISPSYRAPLARPKAAVASVGRLEPRKGHQDVIAAVGLLQQRIPELKLLIAGASVPYAPGYIDQLTKAADGHGIADRVEFLGHVQHIEEVLGQITLLVSASYRDGRGRGGEAFGLAIAEANWAGLPVVATDSGGTTEHVRQGVNGLIVPPRSSEGLSAAIHSILSDSDRAAEMGAAAARLARERFDPEQTAARFFAELRVCA